MNSSNRYDESCGPGDASGWYCTASTGLRVSRKPASVPSLRWRCVGRPGAFTSVCRIDSESVILAGDLDAACALVVQYRLVRAAVAELELVGLRARREREQLMPEADAEGRDGALHGGPISAPQCRDGGSTAAGSPGPLEMKRPSTSPRLDSERMMSAALMSWGTTTTSHPRSVRLRRMLRFAPQSSASTELWPCRAGASAGFHSPSVFSPTEAFVLHPTSRHQVLTLHGGALAQLGQTSLHQRASASVGEHRPHGAAWCGASIGRGYRYAVNAQHAGLAQVRAQIGCRSRGSWSGGGRARAR
jgi:hypothetical protein